jgi:hypothetical protein
MSRLALEAAGDFRRGRVDRVAERDLAAQAALQTRRPGGGEGLVLNKLQNGPGLLVPLFRRSLCSPRADRLPVADERSREHQEHRGGLSSQRLPSLEVQVSGAPIHDAYGRSIDVEVPVRGFATSKSSCCLVCRGLLRPGKGRRV